MLFYFILNLKIIIIINSNELFLLLLSLCYFVLI